MTKEPSVDGAYALRSPEDNKRLYAEWAETYDEGFAKTKDFQMPLHIARLFRELGGGAPVLDVGAGTGLVAEAVLQNGPCVIDAVDLSPEMLKVADRKGLYRHLFEADLTQPLPIEDAQYASVLSSGTFTHGHVGPEALDELMRIARSGALFVLSIKAAHFEEKGFRAAFDRLSSAITMFETMVQPIYGAAGDDPERDKNEGLIAIFRKA